ncbi:DUF1127 domain-containing protein [Mesorhizobium calcicola]|uniref:DUF1127 domain-containing protein n=1 Tax=Mesorhizobium calcicola TaxID=1300310 RepID=A0ABW4WF89_9HYPH
MTDTQACAETRTSKRQLPGVTPKSMATVVAAVTAWQRTIAARRAIKDLTPDQLKDIGCPESPAPKFIVRVGLMTDLMSMR